MPLPSRRALGRFAAAGVFVGRRALIFLVLGLLVDFAVAVGCARWSFPANSYRGVPVTDAHGTLTSYRWGGDVCRLVPENSEIAAPADVSDRLSPVPLRWEEGAGGARRGPVFRWWRDGLLWLDQRVVSAQKPVVGPSARQLSYIRFGFPLRSWEAWWVSDESRTPNGTVREPRPIAGLRVGGTIMTDRWLVARAAPLTLRPIPALVDAILYGGLLAAAWYPLVAWRRRRALDHLHGCPECGYSLVGLATRVCPECGRSGRPGGQKFV